MLAQNRNIPGFDDPPERLFQIPGKDASIRLIKPFTNLPDDLAQAQDAPRVYGCAVSIHKNVKQAQNEVIAEYWRRFRFDSVVEFTTVPIVVRNLEIHHNYRYVDGRFLPNGASSIRFINRYLWDKRKQFGLAKMRGIEADIEDELVNGKSGSNKFLSLGYRGKDVRKLPYVIDCKNYKNYYHFLTESFCHLALVDEWGLEGDIFFVTAMKSSQRRKFCDLMVEDFFPHLKKRIKFRSSVQKFDRAITYYSFREGLGSTEHTDTIQQAFHPDDRGDWKYPRRKEGAVIRRNFYDSSQKSFRKIARDQASKLQDVNAAKRIWVSRKQSDDARDRAMENEDYLISLLKSIGFEVVYFEDHDPVAQAALVAGADIVASYHGAGLANMIYADPKTTVIEIGNLHSATYRWEEFMQHAHVSGCRYVSFFADLKNISPRDALKEVQTNRSMGNIPVKIEEETCHKVLEYIKFLCVHSGDKSLTFDFSIVSELIVSMGDWDLLEELLDSHAPGGSNSWKALSVRATQAIAQGNPKSALDHLEKAIELNPDRSVLLSRAMHIAQANKMHSKFEDLKELFKKRFPVRYRKKFSK